jgi:hypothetical protein
LENGAGDRLDPIIKDLYLEITNIAQGANIAILVYSITARSFLASLATGYLSPAIFALASLLIVVVFWARYYLDTGILERSFTVPAAIWFFAYSVAQGVSISFISTPWAWLAGTGVFLFFGFGFYVLNLSEIRRKQKAGMMPECSPFAFQRGARHPATGPGPTGSCFCSWRCDLAACNHKGLSPVEVSEDGGIGGNCYPPPTDGNIPPHPRPPRCGPSPERCC